MLRNWRLRSKLIVVLVIPLVLAAVLGGLRISSTSQTASDLNALVTRIGLGQQVSALLEELQLERTEATKYVANGRGADREVMNAQFARTDQAAIGVLQTTPEDFGQGDDGVANAALVRLRGIQQIRTAVTETQYPTDAVLTTYTEVISSLQALSRSTLTVQDAQLLRQAEDLTLIGQAKEQIRRQHAALISATTFGRASATEEGLARSSAAEFDASINDFRASAQPAALQLYTTMVSGVDVDNRERIEQGTLAAFTLNSRVNADADAWNAAAGNTAGQIRQVEMQLENQLIDNASALATGASNDATVDVLIVVLAVALTVLVLIMVARSMVRPLRSLRSAAFDVAQRRLPQAIERMQDANTPQEQVAVEPIGIDTAEEIGEVARAFDAVHAEAVRLAGEQALLRANVNDIFVNLSRRSQGLVKRQLGLIDKLESDEQDPDHLSDLFQLDHLATRMRRNNENLLVLAGAAELRPRRRRPVPADDVLRAAVSEVEEYQRVVVRRAPQVSVAGPAVNDLVHLMAELLDNATNFSPPDSTVVLSSSISGGNALVIEIADSGVGIDHGMLQVINAELANPPTVDVAVSRRMGLFVVGRLAQRNEISVQLQPAAGGQGMNAVVTVPGSLLMTPAQAAAAEMATSEFPASGRQATGAWAAPEPTRPAAPATPPRIPAARQEPPAAQFSAHPGESVVPTPRREPDTRFGGWGEFDAAGAAAATGATSPDTVWGRTERQNPPAPPTAMPAPPATPPTAPPTAMPAPQAPQAPPSLPRRQPQATREQQPEPSPAADLFAAGPASAPAATGHDEPIYDEVRTSWFRMQLGSNGGAEDTGAAGSTGGTGNDHPPRPTEEERRPARPAPQPTPAEQAGAEPAARTGRPENGQHQNGRHDTGQHDTGRHDTGRHENGRHENGRPENGSGTARQAPRIAPASEWGPIDNGWLAAREFTELTKEYLTENGLPKRRPRNEPLPGSFAEVGPAGPAARNPEAVRGRLREYQRGLRHGRYAQRETGGEEMAEQQGPGTGRGSE